MFISAPPIILAPCDQLHGFCLLHTRRLRDNCRGQPLLWVAVQTADEARYVIKGLCHSRGQRRCPAGFGSPTAPTSFLRIGYRSILVLRGGCRSGVMERIEKTVFRSPEPFDCAESRHMPNVPAPFVCASNPLDV